MARIERQRNNYRNFILNSLSPSGLSVMQPPTVPSPYKCRGQKTKENGGITMVYTDVIKNGLILQKKEKYTKRDFMNVLSKGFSGTDARFICICSAIYHEVEYSNFFNKNLNHFRYNY